MNKTGTLMVLIGPSGSGKGTVLRELLQMEENTFLSVSATTRAPRPGEEHGKHYFFLSKEEFQALIAEGGLFEYACYVGNYYGTPKAPVEERLAAGSNVILEIEVQGAKQVKQMFPEAVTVFILPPSLSELKRRLVDRNTEDLETVERRLETALQEIPYAYECDYVVVNRTIPAAAAELRAILLSQSCSQRAMRLVIEQVLQG